MYSFCIHAAPELLYPFGTGAGDMFNPRIDDDGGSNVSLRFGRLPYFGSYYQDIYVNIPFDLCMI